VGALPGFVDAVEIGVVAAGAIGCVATATSASTPSAAAGTGIFTAVEAATLRVTLWA
jgi:hypothetical protein